MANKTSYPIYQKDVNITIDCIIGEDMLSRYQKKHGLSDEDVEVGICSDASVIRLRYDDKYLYMVYITNKLLEDYHEDTPYFVGTLAHEAWHLIEMVYLFRGYEVQQYSTNEHISYLLGSLTRELINIAVNHIDNN